MAQQNRTVLKSYFETGDIPTQAQFGDLIDSLYCFQSNTVDDILPTQTGNAGKFLTTNGTISSWATVAPGITSLNGLTAAVQTFANDTNVTIVSAISTQTITWVGQLGGARGGTGIDNDGRTITINTNSAAFTFSGAFTLTVPGTGTTFLAGGLAGGQTSTGGTAASENLTLSSTANATKGKILFGTSAYDEVNNRLGIGTASPSFDLNVSRSSAGSVTFILAQNTNSGAAAEGIIGVRGNNNGQLSLKHQSSTFTTAGLIVANSAQLEAAAISTQLLINNLNPTGVPIIFATAGSAASNERMRIGGNGNVGISSTSTTKTTVATAYLHISPTTGTGAGQTPFKLTNSTTTILAIPEVGGFEFHTVTGVNVLSFTRAGTTREGILVGNRGAAAPATSIGVGIVNFYGTSATNFLADPNTWFSIVADDGVTYKVPAYT